MKHLRKVTAYRVGNKLYKTRKSAERDAGKNVNGNKFLYY